MHSTLRLNELFEAGEFSWYQNNFLIYLGIQVEVIRVHPCATSTVEPSRTIFVLRTRWTLLEMFPDRKDSLYRVKLIDL